MGPFLEINVYVDIFICAARLSRMENNSEKSRRVPAMTEPYQVTAVSEDGVGLKCVDICIEDSVTITVNDRVISRLAVTPLDLVPFVTGYLICEGLISQKEEILEISVELPDIRVVIQNDHGFPESPALEIRSSGAPGLSTDWESLNRPLGDGIRVSVDTIFNAMGLINEMAATWRSTGGTHCTILLDAGGTMVSSAEDMGRHSSVDKAVGMAVAAGYNTADCFMVCTGRLPAGMVAKAYRAGISLVVSNNAPFTTGIDLARRLNITLAGFARPPRALIYSVPERIIFS
jgi:FdhD protein